jgi:hypothetical protein
MSYIRTHARLLLVAVCCVAAGAGASAIATAGAATSATTHHATHVKLGLVRRFAARAVQGSAVVHTTQGFVTVSFDRGKVDSVSGDQLTITEGTPKSSYRTVNLTIPASAKVRDNRHKATLSDITPGQRVLVLVAPKHEFVIARSPRAK